MKESAKKQTAKTKVAAGSLLSANDVPGKFGLSSDAEPLLVCGKTSLLSGDNTVLKGQIYVTPSYLCILTYSNGNEVTLPLPHSALQSIQRVYCPRGDSSTGELTVGPPPPSSSGPNTLRFCYADGSMHTCIAPSNGRLITNWIHSLWDAIRRSPVSSIPLRSGSSPVHRFFSLAEASSTHFGTFKIKLTSGASLIPAFLAVFSTHIGLSLGGEPHPEQEGARPFLIPAASVQYLARASSSKNPDPAAPAPILQPLPPGPTSKPPKAIMIYTADGLLHQLSSISDVRVAYNALVHVVATNIGYPPSFW